MKYLGVFVFLFAGFSVSKGESVAVLSSEHNKFPASNCIDRNANTFCHSKGVEKYPYFMIEYDTPVLVEEVKVQARKDCCGDRVKNVVVTVTNTKPTEGILVSGGTTIGSKYGGPAKNGEVITFKSGAGVKGKYVVVQQQYTGRLNFAEVEVKTGGVAVLSSEHNKFPASNCIDGNANTFCHSKGVEKYPYFMMEYDTPVSVEEVKVQARKDCCGDRVKNMVVTVTNTRPTEGTLVSGGTTIGSKYGGPAKNGEVITFKSGAGVKGKYVVVQQQYTGRLNFAEVEVKTGK